LSLITVTGAAGYLGGRLVGAAAADATHSVRSVVRRPARWLPGEVRIVRDLVDDAAEAVEGASAVIHLAGANEVVAAEQPDRAVAEAFATARAIAEACAEHGVRRLVYVSTIHVYGASIGPGKTVDESTLPRPKHAYAIARLTSEHAFQTYAGTTEVVVLRLTNGVGPPADMAVDRWTLVANDLCRQAVERGTIRLLTPGTQWRDFIALDDACRAILMAAGPGGIDPGVYNLGSGHALTIRDLADLVALEAHAAGLGDLSVEAPETSTASEPPYTISVERLAACGFRSVTPVRQAVAETLAFCLAAVREGQ
jgi:UDP-glucose 4-epimerase